MAYINNVLAVLFIAVAIAVSHCLAEPTPTFPTMNPVCATAMPDLLEKCFATVRETPTQDCCNDLKSATTTQVKCLCDNYIANPDYASYTRPYAAGITSQCGVFDKYSCDGTTKEKGSSSNNNNSNGQENNSTNKDNGGKSNNVASSLIVFPSPLVLFKPRVSNNYVYMISFVTICVFEYVFMVLRLRN